ncbi:MAG: dihydropteridine reductase [Eubacteriales bacterium]
MNRNDQQFIAEKIRTQYMEKQPGDIDTLRKLDEKVRRPANIFAYIFGSIGAVVMGAGMSLVMTDIGNTLAIQNSMTVGITVGVVGMLMAIINYPIYKGILGIRKKKYASKIIALSEKIMNK